MDWWDFYHVWYRFFPDFWIGVLVSCPAQAEAREAYSGPLRPKLRSAVAFSPKKQKNGILAKFSIFSQKLRLWMNLRGGILQDTLVSMPQGLKIQKLFIQNWIRAKYQDSGLKLRISQQVGGTLEILDFICSGAFSNLEIWLFKQKKMPEIFYNWPQKLIFLIWWLFGLDFFIKIR
jgi:hypothetical protein